ncbi:IPT/TIG domain-containing protein [Gryllotalpicola reticulitermitis]|uniref:IPT/TIG domain-containing protein n=1 Tax=Gryllotalpicola reticulitermitis TaxID=1184153 RepID=A0ABV8QCJ1_9MICO
MATSGRSAFTWIAALAVPIALSSSILAGATPAAGTALGHSHDVASNVRHVEVASARNTTVETMTPSVGLPSGGQEIVVSGNGLDNVIAVLVGGAALQPSEWTVHEQGALLTFQSPSHEGEGDAEVTLFDRSLSATDVGTFSYRDAPRVTSMTNTTFSPPFGGSTSLNGTNLEYVTSIDLDGDAVRFDINDPYIAGAKPSVWVTMPSHQPGPASLKIHSQYAEPQTVPVIYEDNIILTGITPEAGPIEGGTKVAFTGYSLNWVSTVTFGGLEATSLNHSNDGNALTAVTPPHASGPVTIALKSIGGHGEVNVPHGFEYTASIAVDSMSPARVPTKGGTIVTVTGANLDKVDSIEIAGPGGEVIPVTVAPGPDRSSLTFVTPPHSPQDMLVTYLHDQGKQDVLGPHLVYAEAPTVTDISPAKGPTSGGTGVTLTGTGFDDVTEVTFGDIAATDISASSGGRQLTVRVPGHSAGKVSIGLASPLGNVTVKDAYTYELPFSIEGVSPSLLPVAGGTQVTISGERLDQVTSIEVGSNAGDHAAAAVTASADGTTLRFVAPPHAAGQVHIDYHHEYGVDVVGPRVTYVAPPTVESLSPDAGTTTGGQRVTISGTGLKEATAVTFDGIEGTDLSVNGTAALTVTTPPHDRGVVSVTVESPFGNATLDSSYTYRSALGIALPEEGATTPSRPTVNGGAEPDATVTLRDAPDGPIIATVNAAANGEWTAQLTKALSPGGHTLIADDNFHGAASRTITVKVAPGAQLAVHGHARVVSQLPE